MISQKHVARYLYHQTDKSNLPSIMEKGIIPDQRKGGRNYVRGRVFLAQKPYNVNEIFYLSKNPIQLKVDKKKMPAGTIFYGHHRRGEIIIEGSVPPSAIVSVEGIKNV